MHLNGIFILSPCLMDFTFDERLRCNEYAIKYFQDEDKRMQDPIIKVFEACQSYIDDLVKGTTKWDPSSPIKGYIIIPIVRKLLERPETYSNERLISYLDSNASGKEKIKDIIKMMIELLEGKTSVNIEVKEDPRDHIMGGKKYINIEDFIS